MNWGLFYFRSKGNGIKSLKSVKTKGWHVDQNVRLTVLQTVSGVGGKSIQKNSKKTHSQNYTKYYRG